jgi:hypothetical protein
MLEVSACEWTHARSFFVVAGAQVLAVATPSSDPRVRWRSVMFQRDPDFDLRRNDLTRYINRAGCPLHSIGRGSPQASLFFKER